MNLPDFLDLAKLGQIGALTLIIIQYFKTAIALSIIPWATMFIGIAVSFLIEYQTAPIVVNWIMIIANGVLGAIMADTGYDFLSGTKSSPFSLPSKKQLTG